MGFGMSMKRWAHGKQHVRQVFNPDPRFAQLALEALEWCLLDRGIPLTEEIIEEARVESDKYPSILAPRSSFTSPEWGITVLSLCGDV